MDKGQCKQYGSLRRAFNVALGELYQARAIAELQTLIDMAEGALAVAQAEALLLGEPVPGMAVDVFGAGDGG